MKNLLLFTYHFPPSETIASQRFGMMCRYMNEFGWTPYVVCPNSIGSLEHGLPTEQIFRIGGFGSGAAPGNTTKSPRGVHPLLALLYRLGKRLRLDLRAFDLSVLTWGREVRRARHKLDQWLPPIDAVLSTFGPAAAHWLARYFAHRRRVPWIADFRDLAALLPAERGSFVRALDRPIEGFLLRRADAFTTVSPTLVELISQRRDLPGQVIFNGWDHGDDEPEASEPRDLDLYYGGRLYPHRMDAFECFLEALARVPGPRMLFQSMGPPDLEQRIRDKATALALGERIDIQNPGSPAEATRLAATAASTLVFEDLDTSEPWSRGTLTGKLMELISLRPPVLVVSRPDSDCGLVLTRTGKGRLCSEVSEIETYLRDLVAGELNGTANADQVAFFSRKNQARELCKWLDERLAAQRA